MLTTTAQFTPRARSLNAQHAASARALGIAGYRHRQQSRGFRFGMWSNYLDDDLKREIRRQQRILKQKYNEQIHRRLAWEKHPFAEDARHALKRMMNSYWHPHDARPHGRSWDDVQPKRQRTPENKDGVRPGRNIEDVERGAMDHLIFGQEEEEVSRTWRSKRMTRRDGPAAQTDHGKPIEQGDFVIDPITNRKVAKHPSPSSPNGDGNIPVKTFKDYRSCFTHPSSPNQVKSQDPTSEWPSVKDLRRDNSFETDTNTKAPDMSWSTLGRADPNAQSGEHGRSHGSADGEIGQLHDTKIREGRAKLWEDAPRRPDSKTDNSYEDKPVVMDQAETTKVQNGPEETPKYDDLHKYRPVQYLDLDRRSDLNVEELSRQHDDVDRYKTVVDEAHGQFDDLQPPSEDLDKSESQPWLADELAKRITEDIDPYEPAPDEAAALQKDAETSSDNLDEFQEVRHNEPDSKPLGFKEKPVKPEVLLKYQSFIEQLETGDFPEPTIEDLRMKYDQAELKQFTAVRDLDPDAKPGSTAEKSSKQYDLEKPDGLPAVQPDKPQDGQEQLGMQKDYETLARMASEELDSADELDHESLQKMSSVKQGQGTQSNYREMLDSLMKQHQRLSDAADREADLALKSARAKTQQSGTSGTKMTGNFVRDFPEEFEKSWTQTLASVPTESTDTYPDDVQIPSENMDGGLEGAFGRPSPSKIQPALDRQLSQKPSINHDDPYSKDPQGLETSYAEECGNDTQPLLVKQYGISSTAGGANQVLPEEATSSTTTEEPTALPQKVSSGSADGPTLYKVLAYDPTMQKVNMAETTSLVPDFASALSPADALLRLSHPTKFFPHFAALEAQGFEIVSGSGDVLIFRKVRPSATEPTDKSLAEKRTEPAPAGAESQTASALVNPIDMTGRPRIISPASANFASPTGYVNYDDLPENEASNLPPPPPRVKYNIDLRREEPVYSGPKYQTHDGQKQRNSLGKRLLVGGVWVAGISYGLGVVSEYFTTGGIDGTGPHGF